MVKTARLGFLVSTLLISIVALNLTSLWAKTSSEKAAKEIASNSSGAVLAGCNPCFEFYLKDSSDGSYLQGATAALLTQEPFNFSSFGFTQYVKSGVVIYTTVTDGSLKEGYTLPPTVEVQISKSSYITKTTSITTSISPPDTVYLDRVPSQPSTNNTSSGITIVQMVKIQNVTLPAVFRIGETTDLKKITSPNKVENLTLDTGKNTIKFNEAVDLSSSEVVNKFRSLDQYVKADKSGVVSIDSGKLPALNKKATIKMKSLPFVKTPRVLVNGKEDRGVVSNISYSSGVLTFDVTHFSTFTAAPTITISEPKDGFETKEKKITLKALVSDPIATVSAYLNGRNLGKLKVATKSGEISSNINLVEGVNKILLNVVSANGATASATVSGRLIAAAAKSNLLLYTLLAILAIVAIASLVYWLVKLRNKKSNSSTNL
ncbi:MAG: hypothetical protein A2172_03315 [Candidatus Woykebacteria bacterium RBG_13_40_15]|uniref:Uncharacterized protein n=1 Tax=Candidatus Woykebacteria bacterium RBG_13_40_15 TaxID=1802593 RepID=A0A1G1W6D1_9BACT|nr:MAG: hypothetical protein A2172_03315 [Candidatus Woykebacteria bacterium RBG_13_40_15]